LEYVLTFDKKQSQNWTASNYMVKMVEWCSSISLWSYKI